MGDLSTPAIGIALTATFGAISVRHPDGSFEDIGRIDGTDSYISMVKRLSSPEQKHLAPPYSSFEEMWSDLPREGPRALKRRLGLPASPDVKILAEMLRSLLELYPTDEEVRTAVISYPPAVALYEEDIVDAAAYLNVRVQGGTHLAQPRELSAAYAGYGRGLCDNPTDKEPCLKQLRHLPEVQVLNVEITSKAVMFHVAAVRGAKGVAGEDISATAFYDESSHRHDVDNLNQLGARLALLLQRNYPMGLPKSMVVIMTGDEDGVADEEIRHSILNVLKAQGAGELEVLVERPEYVASRGAAELCYRGKQFFSTSA